MKKLLFILLIGITFSSCNDSQATKVEVQQDVNKITKEEAMDLLKKWTDAYLAGDAKLLNEVLDDNWIYSGSADGSVSNKSATIEEFSNADYKFSNIAYDDLDVSLFNDIAVVRGSETMEIIGSSGNDTTIIKLRFTDVYKKENGKIKAISTHSSPIILE